MVISSAVDGKNQIQPSSCLRTFLAPTPYSRNYGEWRATCSAFVSNTVDCRFTAPVPINNRCANDQFWNVLGTNQLQLLRWNVNWSRCRRGCCVNQEPQRIPLNLCLRLDQQNKSRMLFLGRMRTPRGLRSCGQYSIVWTVTYVGVAPSFCRYPLCIMQRI